jgi:Flp pilus assembly pilin Flp
LLCAASAGTTAVEYALLAALVSLVIVGGAIAVGTQLPVTLFRVGNSIP